MIRHFPFSKTYKNLAYNLKNFKPSSHRPSFKSSNHPFMSNTQLQNELYTNWIATTLPKRILSHMKASPRRATRDLRPKVNPFALSTSSYYFIPKSLKVDDIESNGGLTELILSLFEKDDLSQVATLLESNLLEKNLIIDPDLVNILIKLSLSEIPLPDFYKYELQVEAPLHQGKVKDTQFYNFIYHRIPDLYRICKSYEGIMFNDRDFQEYYIWLCYHEGDLATMQILIRAYLKQNSEYDSKVLSYAVVLYISNYNTTMAISVLEEIMSTQIKDLDPILLELILQLAIVYDSLYDNCIKFFKLWCESQNNLSPKSLSLMLRIVNRASKMTPVDDISPIMKICDDLNVSLHYMIRTQQLRSQILERNPTKPVKPITTEDIEEINSIATSLRSATATEALTDYYYQWMYFFSIDLKNLNMVLFILHKMKEDEINVGPKFVKIILKFYSNSGKFMNLLEFLKFSLEKLNFNKQYVLDLYEGFIKTYPYLAQSFDATYREWLKENNLKDDLGISIKPTTSLIVPFTLNTTLNPIKYKPEYWKPNSHVESQLETIFKYGFPDLQARGVKPDFEIIKDIYRKTPVNQRHIILDIMKQTKSQSPRKSLAIIRIQMGNYPKNYLKDFIKNEGHGLSAQNRLNITLQLVSKGLGKPAIWLLESIAPEELNDRGSMIRLQKLLNLNIRTYQLKLFIKTIDNFPVNEVVLSPYIYERCCKLEEILVRKIAKETSLKGKTSQDIPALSTIITRQGTVLENCQLITVQDEPMIDQLQKAHKRLQSFIADIQLRLESDKIDISIKINETFKFLNEWITNDNDKDNDERKV